jgi:hypothetical protein
MGLEHLSVPLPTSHFSTNLESRDAGSGDKKRAAVRQRWASNRCERSDVTVAARSSSSDITHSRWINGLPKNKQHGCNGRLQKSMIAIRSTPTRIELPD